MASSTRDIIVQGYYLIRSIYRSFADDVEPTWRLLTKRVMISQIQSLGNVKTTPVEQPPQSPCPHPKQLVIPTPNVRKTNEIIFINPSPRTNPLAMTISRISPLSFTYLVRCTHYTIPPISHAMENEGVFRNPFANAMVSISKTTGFF